MLTSTLLLNQLAETPTRLAALTADRSPGALQTKPTPEEWSANDVLAHLRACADVWGACMLRIIAEDHPAWRAVNPRTYIKQTDYLERDFRPSLDAFTAQRADLLAVLSALPSDAWSRAARVSGGGRPFEPTALSYAERLAVHERTHVKQIGRLVTTLPR